jgi:DNA mismatch repair protein MutS2
MLAEGLAGFERARKELSRRVSEELDAARHETTRLAQASAAKILEEAEQAAEAERVVAEAKEAEELRSQTVEVGEQARIRGLGSEGRVVAFDGDWAHLEFRGKRMRVKRSDLEPMGKARRQTAEGRRQKTDVSTPQKETSGPVVEVNLIGQRVEEAIEAAEKALDQALVSGAASLRVIHGHGTGRLREGLREHFRSHPAVEKLRSGDRSEGGNGATILELR